MTIYSFLFLVLHLASVFGDRLQPKSEPFDQLLGIGYYGRAQVINLDPSVTPCYLLENIYSSSADFNGAFFDGAPTICSADEDICLRYNRIIDFWQETSYFPLQRGHYGHVGTLLDDGRWLISGGYGYDPTADDYEATSIITEFVPSADASGSVAVQTYQASLPYPAHYHIFTNLNSSHLLFISDELNYYANATSSYDRILRPHILDLNGGTEDWQELPSTFVTGNDFYGGVVTNFQGEPEIVITGFYDDYAAGEPGHEDLSTEYTKIFSLAQGKWRDAKGAGMPRHLDGAAVVPGFGDTFIIAGGTFYFNEGEDRPNKKLYAFDPLGESWVELEAMVYLYEGMYYTPVFSVPKGYFQC